jgi:hypothetical protein
MKSLEQLSDGEGGELNSWFSTLHYLMICTNDFLT